jgi:flagellar biosynthetic protein FliR
MASAALYSWATGVMLIAVRLAMLFVSTPVFGDVPIPVMARVILILGLSAGFSGTLHFALPPHPDAAWLFAAVLHEVIVGGAMATGLFAGFGAFSFGGRLLDFQIGFGIANLIDLATKNNAPLLGTILSMLAVLIFFGLNGHLIMLKMLYLSFAKLPIGSTIASLNLGALIAYFSTCFVFGFAIVAPVVLCLFIIDMGVAFMSRTMPQMNVFVMSLGLKVIVGLLVLTISLPFAGGLIHTIFESIFNNWNQLVE